MELRWVVIFFHYLNKVYSLLLLCFKMHTDTIPHPPTYPVTHYTVLCICVRAHTHTDTYTWTHTHTHTHIYVHTHIHIHYIDIHICMQTPTHSGTYAQSETHIHTHTDRQTHNLVWTMKLWWIIVLFIHLMI